MVYGRVDIDMIAGPSEILIIADETANSRYIAADMMSQAEHDKQAGSILITTSEKLIERVESEIEKQLAGLKRKEIITGLSTSRKLCIRDGRSTNCAQKFPDDEGESVFLFEQ
jgi:histidinol dehydrogenase